MKDTMKHIFLKPFFLRFILVRKSLLTVKNIFKSLRLFFQENLFPVNFFFFLTKVNIM